MTMQKMYISKVKIKVKISAQNISKTGFVLRTSSVADRIVWRAYLGVPLYIPWIKITIQNQSQMFKAYSLFWMFSLVTISVRWSSRKYLIAINYHNRTISECVFSIVTELNITKELLIFLFDFRNAINLYTRRICKWWFPNIA